MEEIRLSVRNLVEFLLRSGNLDSGSAGNQQERAVEGARIHRRLQKAAGDSYQAEVFFSHVEAWQELCFHVEGRADGVFEENGIPVIDEIKTISLPLSSLPEEGVRVHWAQAMCYAHFYAVSRNCDEVSVRLTYCQTETEELRRMSRTFSAAQLSDFFQDLLSRYAPWARFRLNWEPLRNTAIKAMPFPFDKYRNGQRALAAAVYRAIRDEKRLFCQAPTGVGKTISTLFPAVKAMGEGLTSRIFYLTAKTVTRQAAADALSHMRQKNMRLKSVILTAKEKICCLEAPECTPLSCPRAAGHFDRVNQAIYELLTEADHFDRTVLEHAAREHQVCPLELSLDLSEWCDVVICDYNYLFDPVTSLKRYFMDEKTDFTFLIDESHNLPERGREMYTAELEKSAVLALKKEIGKQDKALGNMLASLNTAMLALRPLCGDTGQAEYAEMPEDFLHALYLFSTKCAEWLEKHRDHPSRRLLLPLWFDVRFFLRISEKYGPEYITQLQHRGSEVKIRLFCRDSARFLDESMGKGRAAILFSATLSPLPYFVSLLGGGEEARTLSVPSPFPQEHLLLLLADRVSTRYADRQKSLPEVAQMIGTFARAGQGNCIAYFPSYQYMEQARALVKQYFPDLRIVSQGRDMKEKDREEFLSLFSEKSQETLLGFCVMGGIFSEGIDFCGDRLVGAVIVGVGLPQVNKRQELLKEYYEQANRDGFSFAYRFPGMNKVMQAAGRVIRSESDRGAVLLIDSRFSQQIYRSLFPPHWNTLYQVRKTEDISELLKKFWTPKL